MGAEQGSVLQRLSKHREEMKLLVKFIRNQEIKYKEGSVFLDIGLLEECQICFKILNSVMKTDGLESYFGVHVLLYELDNLFINSISKFKIDFNNYTTDMSYDNSEKPLETLKKDLSTVSFIKYDVKSRTCSINFDIMEREIMHSEFISELEKYYSIGTTLKEDSTTLLLLKELRNLRLQSREISPFSVIIGPSYIHG